MKNTNTLREHPKDPLLTFQTVETQKLELIHCDLSIKSNTGKHCFFASTRSQPRCIDKSEYLIFCVLNA